MDIEEVLIGNTLEETAYHEAGHIVIASATGLALRPMGVAIWEAVEDVTEGIASYCEDEPEWEKILLALRAREMAQVKQFPIFLHNRKLTGHTGVCHDCRGLLWKKSPSRNFRKRLTQRSVDSLINTGMQ
jgi:hypothetical protein